MTELDKLAARVTNEEVPELTKEERDIALENFGHLPLQELEERDMRMRKTTSIIIGDKSKHILNHARLQWVLQQKRGKVQDKSNRWLEKAKQNQQEAIRERAGLGEQGRALSTKYDALDEDSTPRSSSSGRKGILPLHTVSTRPGSLLRGTPLSAVRAHKDYTPNGRIAGGSGSASQQAGQRASQHSIGQRDTRSIEVPKLKGASASNIKPSGVGLTKFLNSAPAGGGKACGAGDGGGLGYGSSRNNSPAEPAARRSNRQAAKKQEEDAGPIEISSDEEGAADVGGREPEGQAPQDTVRRTTRGNAYRTTSQKYEGLRGLYPPNGGLEAVQVDPSDLARLDPDEFLNDTVIDFMAKFILTNQPGGEEMRCKFYYFNSFFYKKLTEKSGGEEGMSTPEANHDRVKKWTKQLDIFEKEFLLIPIHDHLHWSLLIVCHPASCVTNDGRIACMIHLDSMPTGGHGVTAISRNVRNYLQLEWKRKAEEPGTVAHTWHVAHPEADFPRFTETSMPHKKPPHVPKQENHCDCGLFLLTFIDFFTFAPPAIVDPKHLPNLEEQHEYPLFFSKKWFSPENAGKLRKHMRLLILDLFLEQAPPAIRDSDAYHHALQEKSDLEDESKKYRGPAAQLAENEKMKQQKIRNRALKAEEVAIKKAEAAALAEEKSAERAKRRANSDGGRREGSAEERRLKAAEAAEQRRSGSSQEEFAVHVDSEEPDNLAAEPDTVTAKEQPPSRTRPWRKVNSLYGSDTSAEADIAHFAESSQGLVPEEMREHIRIKHIMNSDDEDGEPSKIIVTVLGDRDRRGGAKELASQQFETRDDAVQYMHEQWQALGLSGRQESDNDCQLIEDDPSAIKRQRLNRKQADPKRDIMPAAVHSDYSPETKRKKRGRGLFSAAALAEHDSLRKQTDRAEEVEEIGDSDHEAVQEVAGGSMPNNTGNSGKKGAKDPFSKNASSRALRGDAASSDDQFEDPVPGSSAGKYNRHVPANRIADLFSENPASPVQEEGRGRKPPTGGEMPLIGSPSKQKQAGLAQTPRSSPSKLLQAGLGAAGAVGSHFLHGLQHIGQSLGVSIGRGEGGPPKSSNGGPAGGQGFSKALSDTAGTLEGAETREPASVAEAPDGEDGLRGPGSKQHFGSLEQLKADTFERFESRPALRHGTRHGPALEAQDRAPTAEAIHQLRSRLEEQHPQAGCADQHLENERQAVEDAGRWEHDPGETHDRGERADGRGQHADSRGERTNSRGQRANGGLESPERPHVWENGQVPPGSPPDVSAEAHSPGGSLQEPLSSSEDEGQRQVGPSKAVDKSALRDGSRRKKMKMESFQWGLSDGDWSSGGPEGLEELAAEVEEVTQRPKSCSKSGYKGAVDRMNRFLSRPTAKGSKSRKPGSYKSAKQKGTAKARLEHNEDLRMTPSTGAEEFDVDEHLDSGISKPPGETLAKQRHDGLELPRARSRGKQIASPAQSSPDSPGHVSGLTEGLDALDISRPQETDGRVGMSAQGEAVSLSGDDSDDGSLAKPTERLGRSGPSSSAGELANGTTRQTLTGGASDKTGKTSSNGCMKTFSRRGAKPDGGVHNPQPYANGSDQLSSAKRKRHRALTHGSDGEDSDIQVVDPQPRSQQEMQEEADHELARRIQAEDDERARRAARTASAGYDSDSEQKDPDYQLPRQPARLVAPSSTSPSNKKKNRRREAQQTVSRNQLSLQSFYS